MKQETKLEKLGIYSNRIIYLQHQACISRLFGALSPEYTLYNKTKYTTKN